MKVALVILHADPARGGAERYTVDLSAGLIRRGHAVSILASSFADLPAGVSRVSIPATGWTRVGQYHRFLDGVDRAASGFDVVHAMLPVRRCDFYHPHAGVAAAAVGDAGRLGRLNFRRVEFAKIEKRLLSVRPPTVICLSDRVGQVVRRHYPTIPQASLVKLFNSVDLEKFDPALLPDGRARCGTPPDAVVGLMMAQDFVRKGVGPAIRAMARVPDKRLRLVVAGRPDPSAFQLLASLEHVADRVRFVGHTTDPASLYRWADFFVLPTKHDPCSLVVLEALAMGLPVISTAANGACEIMADGIHGKILSSPDDLPGLTAAMSGMLDPVQRARQSEACLNLRPKLSYEAHLDRVEAIYRTAKLPG